MFASVVRSFKVLCYNCVHLRTSLQPARQRPRPRPRLRLRRQLQLQLQLKHMSQQSSLEQQRRRRRRRRRRQWWKLVVRTIHDRLALQLGWLSNKQCPATVLSSIIHERRRVCCVCSSLDKCVPCSVKRIVPGGHTDRAFRVPLSLAHARREWSVGIHSTNLQSCVRTGYC